MIMGVSLRHLRMSSLEAMAKRAAEEAQDAAVLASSEVDKLDANHGDTLAGCPPSPPCLTQPSSPQATMQRREVACADLTMQLLRGRQLQLHLARILEVHTQESP